MTAAPERLEAIVLGGSNSMLAEGWVDLLQRNLSGLARVENRSVGAATTVMGLCRLLGEPRPAGAAVYWEYGLNEYNHLGRGRSLDDVLHHLEWLIQICIRENRPLVPVLMRNRRQVERGDDAYVPAVTRLFADYAVPVLDVQMLIRVLSGSAYAPGDWYAGDLQYAVDTELPTRIAETVLLMHAQARPPRQRPDRAARFEPLELRLLRPEGAAERFSNAALTLDFAPFAATPAVTGRGRALAATVVTSGSGPAVEIDAGAGRVSRPMSTRIAHGGQHPPRQLHQLVLSDHGLDIRFDGRLAFRAVTPEARPLTENMFVWQPPAEQPDPLGGNGLAAVLCETPRIPE